MDVQTAMLNIKTEVDGNEEADEDGEMKLEMGFKVEMDTGVSTEIELEHHVKPNSNSKLPGPEEVAPSSDDVVPADQSPGHPVSPVPGSSGCKQISTSSVDEQTSDKKPSEGKSDSLQLYGEKGVYQCKSCKYSTDSTTDIERHQVTHTGLPEFKCGQCQRTFSLRSNLKRHVQTAHEGLKPHKSDLCSKSFSRMNYECGYCSARFPLRGDLTAHLHTRHDIKPLKCKYCSERFSVRADLTKHLHQYHGVKLHESGDSSARVSRGSRSTAHSPTRTDGRFYTCAHCKARFLQLENMNRHVMAKHKHS